jgi:hypothetical protein
LTTTVKRSLIASFLNTGTYVTPVWSIIGPGVTAAKIAYNPKTLQETYINEDSGRTLVESYSPNMPIEATVISDDPVFMFVDALRQGRSVLDSAVVDICNVWKYMTPALGYYAAERQAAELSCDDFGGPGGEVAKIKVTINYAGACIPGSFNPTTLAFTAAPVLAVLATMVIGAVTLTPLFATDKTWLHYAGAVSNATTTVTMTSTCTAAGAVVLQKDTHASTVAQGAAASLDVGVNHLTIQITVGTEVVIYHIDITRAAS